MEEKTTLQSRMLANRLVKRFRHLKKWAQRTGAGAFRLYDRDIPEVPLVLDFYGDLKANNPGADMRDAFLSGALYERPYEKDDAEETAWLCAMRESAALALGISPGNVFLKRRQKQRGAFQYEKMAQTRVEKIISEGGLKFLVNLSDYLDTGLFADRRLLRAAVRAEASGKKVLNLFSYTGSFSVYAAAGGAVSTDSVDLSNTYLDWARKNFELNGFSSMSVKGLRGDEKKDNVHKLIRADAVNFIDQAVKDKLCWDIIIVDPPAFSNSKKMTDDFDLNRDLTALLGGCLKLLSPCGKIFVSVNLHRKAPNAREMEAELRNMNAAAALQVVDLKNKITDEDFKDRKIPGAFLVRRQIIA